MKRRSALDPGILDVAHRLRRAVDRAARKARALRRPVLAWAAARVGPVDLLEAFARSSATDRMLWQRPGERFGLLGVGSAWTLSPEGPGRFEEAAAGWRACVEDAIGDDNDPDASGAAPLGVGGFAFSPDGPARAEWSGFPAAALLVPRVCVSIDGDVCRLILAVAAEPDGQADDERSVAYARMILDPDRPAASEGTGARGGTPVLRELPPAERWKATIERAVQAVRDGQLRKIVLARAVSVLPVRARPATALRTLCAEYPSCAILAVTRGDRCFLGATPERLARIRGGRVSTAAVAGSAPRGRTSNEDDRLGEALLRNPKDRLEHAVVADMLRDVISETCADVTPDGGPTLLKIANIQHLTTPLAGRLREPMSILELAGRLHPTPAVGGFPRDRALRWIQAHEEVERGWYAGPVGWLDRHGEGECAVAIRSALLSGDVALLFAGCGIVADSDPDEEYAESWLKLRPMLSALGVDGPVSAAGSAGPSLSTSS